MASSLDLPQLDRDCPFQLSNPYWVRALVVFFVQELVIEKTNVAREARGARSAKILCRFYDSLGRCSIEFKHFEFWADSVSLWVFRYGAIGPLVSVGPSAFASWDFHEQCCQFLRMNLMELLCVRNGQLILIAILTVRLSPLSHLI